MKKANQHPTTLNLRQIVIAMGCLILGTAVYCFARPPGSTFFLPGAIGRAAPLPEVLRPLAGSLPVLAHLIAFSLFSSAVLGCGRRGAKAVCLGWGLIHTVFEAGQHPAVRAWLAPSIPDVVQHIHLLRWSGGYFTGGTFDALDLAAVVLGVVIAYALFLTTERRINPS